MGKRKRDKEKDEVYIKKKIKKLQEKLQRHSVEPDRSSTPPVQPQSKTPQQPPTEDSSPSPASSPLHTRPHDDPDINAEIVDDELPEEFLLALGTEGQEQAKVGNPIRPELASRWTKIMNDGLDCADKIRAAQTIQKTSNTIKNHPEKEKKQQKQAANNKQFKQLNWKSPPQYKMSIPYIVILPWLPGCYRRGVQ
ncbi:uncharacterized protein LOC125228700 [Leguminivora glycinivorella]|uniref:uncharacterized protein LOC125228700 n=1 Tax=Leguminivora glycinivorella TaxID=1035111 RepID=UPI00200D426D|nr:uncharacterized protein LOC125228700 [Leguminivora glycinivorella]